MTRTQQKQFPYGYRQEPPVWMEEYRQQPRQARQRRQQSDDMVHDMNDTTRVVVAGAVTIGALGLLGNMMQR